MGDGKGTAKDFLQAIASQESEAERSLMHRFVIQYPDRTLLGVYNKVVIDCSRIFIPLFDFI